MSEAPSFYQLFRRSRHAAVPTDEAAPEGSQNSQTEVFAVAALGFVLRHEPAFLAHFLAKIRPSNPWGTEKCAIRCQDGHKADLAMVWPGERVVVVEAKINARLQAKQDPRTTAFWEKPEGYGYQINRDYPREPERYYVVLAKDASESPPPGTGGQVPAFLGFRRWGELDGSSVHTSLVRDFLETLGALGISELQMREFSNMKLEASTPGAANMFKLLDGLADQFDIRNGKDRWDIARDQKCAHFGVNLGSGKQFAQLAECLGASDQNRIGWFGYESLPSGESRRAVWIYTNGKKCTERVRRFANDNHLTVDDADADFAIRVSPENGGQNLDDVPWFQTVLGRLSDRGFPGDHPPTGNSPASDIET